MRLPPVLATALLPLFAALPVQAQFPLTLPHAFGETVIPAPPERIITLGWIAQDVVLALGLVPLALPRQAWGGDAEGLMPWVRAAIEAQGGALPLRFDDTALPYESLLMLQPELILAPYSGLRAPEYARLSQIAPTLAWRDAPWTGDWRDITRLTGRALGREPEAEALVAQTQATLQDTAARHPEFRGVTFVIGSGDPSAGSVGLHRAADPRVRLLEELGLRLAPSVEALPGDGFYTQIGFEALGRLEADLFILWQSGGDELAALLDHPVFAAFGPVARGCLVPLVDRTFVMATSAPSPLSIPWALDLLVPMLASALDSEAGCR